MRSQPYLELARYKQWADRGLHEAVAANFRRLEGQDKLIMLRVLDHIHVVDRIFQHHLQGTAQPFAAPHSEEIPALCKLAAASMHVGDWYVSYVRDLPKADFDEAVDFAFTDGSPGRMTRGEILLHICLHGTYHRGNAGIILQKSGVSTRGERVTDFMGAAVA